MRDAVRRKSCSGGHSIHHEALDETMLPRTEGEKQDEL
jgi:hypothetical protein